MLIVKADIRLHICFTLQALEMKIVNLQNSVVLDETAHIELSHQDLHFLPSST